MIQRRLIAVLVFFFAVAFVVVHFEARKVRHARQIARLNRQVLQLSYQQWDAQATLAELCSPTQLLQRTSQMALGTIAPSPVVPVESHSGQELAAGR